MGRRNKRQRANSDEDLTLEKIYDSRRRAVSGDDETTKSGNKNNDTSLSKAVTDDSSSHENKKQKVESEADKIEALRKKKQERKQRQQEKQAEKAKQAEALKEARKKLVAQQQQQKAAEKKKEKKTNANQSFTTTRKGVQYQDILVGKGPVVQDRKKVRVAYTLRAKNRFGKILDTSDDFGFRLGRGEVIDGWDIGVQGMRQGGKRFLIVPPEAGYGRENIGGGPGATLFFEVTVLKC